MKREVMASSPPAPFCSHRFFAAERVPALGVPHAKRFSNPNQITLPGGIAIGLEARSYVATVRSDAPCY